MRDVQPNYSRSIFARIRDKIEDAVERVRFELSTPSRESRAYFNGPAAAVEYERSKLRQDHATEMPNRVTQTVADPRQATMSFWTDLTEKGRGLGHEAAQTQTRTLTL